MTSRGFLIEGSGSVLQFIQSFQEVAPVLVVRRISGSPQFRTEVKTASSRASPGSTRAKQQFMSGEGGRNCNGIRPTPEVVLGRSS